jgi:hypothetical protein
MLKLDVKGFALTCALVWGVGVPILTWWMMMFDQPNAEPIWLSRVYRGYSVTVAGSLIGAAWGFVDGLLGGAAFAWLYNRLGRRSERQPA